MTPREHNLGERGVSPTDIFTSYYIGLKDQQGADTRICAILTVATGLGDPVYCGNGRGSPYCFVYYRKVTSHCGYLP